MLERASAIAFALAGAGIGQGDRVAILANNSVDWLAADFGSLLGGCVVVPIFATLAVDQIAYIWHDSDTKLCFVDSAADVTRLREAVADAPRLIAFAGDGPETLSGFEAAGATASKARAVPLATLTQATRPDDLAVLIYTSGTTGVPKGVMLSHTNLVSNAEVAAELLLAELGEPGTSVLSVLPFAHIYEHTLVNMYVSARTDLTVTRPEFLLEDMRAVHPRCLALVPRIFERMLAGIVGKAAASGGLTARLVPWALGVGRAYLAATQDGGRPGLLQRLGYAVARALVLRKIKPALGLDRLVLLISGSAPLHRDLVLTFAALGLPIAEGYGLTEAAPIVACSHANAIRYGSVGRPLPGVDVRIESDGEIAVHGPNVMLGYYHLPDERPYTADGYLLTGDIGAFDRDGFLFITDRKKELLKTSAGKFVAPARVEAALKRSRYVGQCVVSGNGRAHPIALVAPNWDLMRVKFGIAGDVSTAAIASRADVLAFLEREVSAASADLASFEAVRRIALLPRDLTIEDGELSPTLKTKRRIVERTFAPLIESAYA